MSNSNTTININLDGVANKIKNISSDKELGKYLALTWSKLFTKYTPMETGTLGSNVSIVPFQVIYESRYAHYQWVGLKYVDPVYLVGGFYTPGYGWWSRPGVTKIPTNVPLNYSKEFNPNATSHWEVPAYNEFKDTVANLITDYIAKER